MWLANDEPSALEDLYWPHDILADPDPTEVGDVEQLLDVLGYVRVGWVDYVSAPRLVGNRNRLTYQYKQSDAPSLGGDTSTQPS